MHRSHDSRGARSTSQVFRRKRIRMLLIDYYGVAKTTSRLCSPQLRHVLRAGERAGLLGGDWTDEVS